MTLQKTRLLGTATSTKNVPRGSFTVKRHFILRVCKLQENTFRVFIDFGFANYRCSSCKLRVHISGGGSFPLASVTSLADPFPLPSVDTNNLKPTSCSVRKQLPRAGNLGHITRISNRLIQLGNGNSHIHEYIQGMQLLCYSSCLHCKLSLSVCSFDLFHYRTEKFHSGLTEFRH